MTQGPLSVVAKPHGPDQDLDLMEKAADHSVDVTTSTAIVLPLNKMRTSATLTNDSDAVIYIRRGQDAALNTGIRLNPTGGAYEITLFNMFKGAISAIHGGTGNKRLCIDEVESRYAY